MDKPVGELISEYAALRDILSDERKKFKKFEADIKEKMTGIEMEILEAQQNLGVNSLSNKEYTAFQTTKKYVRVRDWDRFINFVMESKLFQLLEKRVAKLAALELFEEGTVPSEIGLDKEEEVAIQIRKR